MTTRKLTSIAMLPVMAALVLGAGCSKTASDQVDTAKVTITAPDDATKSALVAQAQIAYETAVKKADGDRNFTIAACTKLDNSQAMPCMNKADAEFTAARDRAKAELDAASM